MNVLEIQSLSKSFGGLKAVNNVNLELRKGEILGVIGPNGAGKTTLFNLISGFIRPDKGSIQFLGQMIVGLQPYEICKLGLTRTFQIVKPFANLSVIHNVVIGAFNRLSSRPTAEDRAREMIRFVGLERKAHFPANTLNIAELKRLELAKALATEPKLLLLDEVMAGINIAEREEIVQIIHQIRDNGVTIMIIGHEVQEILKVADRLIVINFGEKIAEGLPNDVICTKEVIEAYLGEEYKFVRA